MRLGLGHDSDVYYTVYRPITTLGGDISLNTTRITSLFPTFFRLLIKALSNRRPMLEGENAEMEIIRCK